MNFIGQNLREVRERIARAESIAGRPPGSVRLVAVSKTFPPEAVLQAIAGGQRCFGENRVQEAAAKITRFRDASPIEWHLLGHLQSNKVRRAAELFDVIHSLDSMRLATRLSEAGLEIGKRISVLLQVDLGQEETKFGAGPGEVRGIVSAVSNLEGIRLSGLMILPPFFQDPELARPYFSRLRELSEALEREQPGCLGERQLSMGMSHDFEIAIEEGATLVRIGTAIFGERPHA